LAASESLSKPAQSLFSVIAENSSQLHTLTIDEARQAFKPISKSILQLAAQARGAEAEASFIHYYCSMVPGGEGDWLQPSAPLANPYWGSKMLRCGVAASELSPSGAADDNASMSAGESPTDEPPCCEAASSTQEFDEQAEPKPAAKPSCCDESIPARAREETKP
jgi:hypothetical protein